MSRVFSAAGHPSHITTPLAIPFAIHRAPSHQAQKCGRFRLALVGLEDEIGLVVLAEKELSVRGHGGFVNKQAIHIPEPGEQSSAWMHGGRRPGPRSWIRTASLGRLLPTRGLRSSDSLACHCRERQGRNGQRMWRLAPQPKPTAAGRTCGSLPPSRCHAMRKCVTKSLPSYLSKRHGNA